MRGLPEPEEGAFQAHEVLRQLGLSANYRGFYQMACALRLAQKEPERLLLVTKYMYPDVAKQCRTTPAAVERTLRTAVRVICESVSPLLWEIVGGGAGERPCTARFLALLTAYLAGEAA